MSRAPEAPSLYDISPLVDERISVWPGDTPYSAKDLLRMEDGAPVHLSMLTLSCHTGAHADAPGHYVKGAEGIDAVPLSLLDTSGTFSTQLAGLDVDYTVEVGPKGTLTGSAMADLDDDGSKETVGALKGKPSYLVAFEFTWKTGSGRAAIEQFVRSVRGEVA